jgi:hypothetical protein
VRNIGEQNAFEEICQTTIKYEDQNWKK